ncbi:hypothetical protein [Novosphingobium sp. 9U]|uniref:hypothetical protein n=1 Tax=Novosphingobium sp. 9U TaxID=2653158 RepID=UPI0012EFA8F2|nr:hypothetical protein [Novosphingobium sp. 9U]VWX50986.1 hypothetical protein NOVOSPHI9U_370010 [Novosphingobium sp. 9U]
MFIIKDYRKLIKIGFLSVAGTIAVNSALADAQLSTLSTFVRPEKTSVRFGRDPLFKSRHQKQELPKRTAQAQARKSQSKPHKVRAPADPIGAIITGTRH